MLRPLIELVPSDKKIKLTNPKVLDGLRLPNYLREKLQDALSSDEYFLQKNSATRTTRSQFSVFPSCYFYYAFELYELALEIRKYIDLFELVRGTHKKLLLKVLGDGLLTSTKVAKYTESEKDEIYTPKIEQLHSIFIEDNNLLQKGYSADDILLFVEVLVDAERRFQAKSFVDSQSFRGVKESFNSILLAATELANTSNETFGYFVYELAGKPEIYVELVNYFSNLNMKVSKPLNNVGTSVLPKPFILLAGISGTGKTRFVKQQAEPFGELSRNFCLVPVRPDWHEPSDIFGYWSRLNASAGREYVATKTLSFLVKAWADIVLSVGANNINFDEQKNAVVVTGAEQMIKSAQPFWLCFDEMNLAPVEQYLADYLSVLEMRCWTNIDDDYQYESPTLLDAEVFSTGDTAKLRTELGLHSSDYDQVWQLLGEFGLALPYNLLVAGTVNMDETTHQFSRKVLDRAMSIDFEAFYPVNFDSVFSPSAQPVTFTYPTVSHITDKNQLSTVSVDSEGQLTTQFITAINTVLDGTAFKLAYRAYNELLISLHSFNPQTLPELAAVWDDFVMYKVLPRLEGDVDKLLTVQGNNLLEALHSVLTLQFEHLSTNNQRADLFSAATTLVALRSCNKVTTMNKRLLLSGATSFWL